MRPCCSFSEVDSRGNFEVYLSYADTCKIEVECESNILQYVVTKFERNRFIVKQKNNVVLDNSEPVRIYATTPLLKYVELSGSGRIFMDDVQFENLTLSLSGSGEILYRDYVDCSTMTMDVSGSGRIHATSIRSEQTNIDIDGSGICQIDLIDTDRLDLDIDGSGSIDLSGECNYVDLRVEGSGRLDAYDLMTKKYAIRINGSGCAYINVSDELNILVKGSGNVYYQGYPSISMTGDGSGGLINMNP